VARYPKLVRLPFMIALIVAVLWAVVVKIGQERKSTRLRNDYGQLKDSLTDFALSSYVERERLEGLAEVAQGRMQKDAAALLMQLKYLTATRGGGKARWAYLRMDPGELDLIQRNLERIKAGERLYKCLEGPFLRAYYSDIDGSFQPYSICIPAGYREERVWPLIVQLHENRGFSPFQCVSATCYAGAICVSPEGRKASDYMFIGEDDVLDVLREVSELYSVDQDRIYLVGRSMGGTGCWSLAARYPHLFAGIVAIAGDMGYGAVGADAEADARGGYAELRSFLRDKHSPLSFAENLAQCRVRAIHGTGDEAVPVERARRMVSRLRGLGCDLEYLEFPQSAHGEFPAWAEDYAMASLFAAAPRGVPDRFSFKTADLRNNRAWWLRIDRLLAPDRFSEVSAEIEGSEIKITTANVGALTLLLGRLPEATASETLNVDGTVMEVPQGTGRDEFAVELYAGQWRQAVPADELVKMRGLSGPFSDVFRDPFLVVYGTAGDSELWRDICRREAERFVWEWELRYGEPCRLKPDDEVDPSDIERFNLLLFGGPAVNRVSGRIAEGLPVAIEEGAIKAGERSYEGADVGVMLCYPNPLNRDRMIALVAGACPGALFQAYDRFGLWFDREVYDKQKWFDYAVYDARTNGPETYRAVGFFDNCWRLPSRKEPCPLGGGKQWEGLAEFRERNLPQRFPRFAETPEIELEQVYVSDLLPASIRQYRGAVGIDRSYAGGRIEIASRLFEKGLGTMAPSEISYDVGGRFRRFNAVVGFTEGFRGMPAPAEGEAVVFEVWGDGKRLWRSPAMRWQEGQQRCEEVMASVRGVQRLTLKTLPAEGERRLRGAAAWGDPVLAR